MASTVLFEDVFTVRDKDPHGKRFDRVSRVICEGMSFNIELILDLNTQLYPVDLNDRFTLCLASTLSMDDEPDDGYYNQNRNASRADNFDYVMHGTIYRIEDTDNGQQLAIYISFGGLLMRLKGDTSTLNKPGLDLDTQHYLLIRRAQ